MGRSSGAGSGGAGGGFSGGGRSSGGFSGGARSGGRSARPSSYGPGPGFGPRGGFGGPLGGYPRRRYGSGSFMGGFLGSLLGSAMSDTQKPATPPSSPTTSGAPSSPEAGSSVPRSSQGGAGGCGCGTLFILLCVVLLAWGLFSAFGCDQSGSSAGSGAYAGVASTHQREKLPQGTAQITPYYNDLDGDWIHNTALLEEGLRAFADKTGVMPYVYILPNGSTTSTSELTQIAQEVYEQNFDDEGHFVLVFCDNGQGGYNCGYCTGSAARSVMDDEAVSILAKHLDASYANQNLSEEEIFSQAFLKTAQEIMADPAEAQRPFIVGAVVVGAGAVALVLWGVHKRRAAKREAEQKRLDDLLNQPLETFGDQELDDLEKKYTDKGSSQ